MTSTLVAARADDVPRRRGLPGARVLGRVVSWALIVLIAASVTVAVAVPRLGGATPYTVLTGSMRPELPPGTLVVVRPVPAAAVDLGSVITYQLESGRAAVVTHRVVQVSTDADGQPVWRTQGDANPVPDADWVTPVQLKGELWYSVPQLGRVNLWFTDGQRRAAVVLVASVLFAYAAVALVGGVRDRARARRAVTR